MGKKGGKRTASNRHEFDLAEQMNPSDDTLSKISERRKRSRGKRGLGDSDEEELPQDADANFEQAMGEKILKEAKLQRLEMEREAEERSGVSRKGSSSYSVKTAITNAAKKSAKDDSDSDEEEARDGYVEDYEYEVSAEDERILQTFLDPNAESKSAKTLSDIIAEKLREREHVQEDFDFRANSQATAAATGLSEKAVEVYKQVGSFLSRYKSGSVPKAFKIIPNLSNWEEILYITDYDSWSVQAMYQATRLFASNLNAKMAQRFFSLVLLPRVRMEIKFNRKLHFALFQALKKAAYKPGAFFKGLLLPLCQSGTCTVLEAVIFSAVINRISIPVLHSSAALLRLAEMRYTGINSFFIKILLEKKYALPFRVIDTLVDSFVAFEREERELPVIWHQSFLTFIQRYKHAITKEDKARLRKLAVKKGHYLVGPEILREIDHGHSRGEKPKDDPQDKGAFTSMKIVEDVKDFPPVLLMDED
ncbi:bystin [Chloropicon primus]|uniref:Bystin n=2 Tax=Chloropicon primus TaxID=1764295 RepID=A0A5B8MC71_9CHLO|nr:bystin [Chloropicon primus]UPQ97188.1 bystin [Chloropicon primus]|eukprot:QDZ17973.1 bystin [Chloropicon primus]